MGCWEFLWFVPKLKWLGPCGFCHRLTKCYFWPYFQASVSYRSRLSLKSSWEICLSSARQLGLVQYVRPELGFGLWVQRFIKYQNSMFENKSITKAFKILDPIYNKPHEVFSLLADFCNYQTFFILYANSFLTSFSLTRSVVIWYFDPRKEMDSCLVLCAYFWWDSLWCPLFFVQ